MARHSSILGLIGDTPLVEVSQLSPNPDVRILMKLEGSNPGGSVKDRVALSLVEQAEEDGILKPGQPDQVLIEPTSGNTGIGLALVCRVKGYHLKVVLPTNVSIERRQLLELWGAEIIESPGAEGSNGAVRKALRLAAEHPEWVFLYQYANLANPKAHYEGTGPEIWRDCPEVTHFVAGLGTSGTLLGVGRYLKERNPGVQVWAVEPPAGEIRRRAAQPRRRLHPAHLRGARRRGAPGPKDGGAAPGIDRVDPPPRRGGVVRRASHRERPWPGRPSVRRRSRRGQRR